MIKIMAVSALLLSSSAAFADPAKVAVSYKGIDLSTSRGVAMLDRRIARAADSVCGTSDVDIRDLTRYQAAQACRAKVVADAAPQRYAAIQGKRSGAVTLAAAPTD